MLRLGVRQHAGKPCKIKNVIELWRIVWIWPAACRSLCRQQGSATPSAHLTSPACLPCSLIAGRTPTSLCRPRGPYRGTGTGQSSHAILAGSALRAAAGFHPRPAWGRAALLGKTARDNLWTEVFALAVCEEYRRFLFLACTADHVVTPSVAVDEAWHLHLIYTKSYWIDLCDGALGRPLHHVPTKGGAQEQAIFRDCYARTLANYERSFGCKPPPNIWPDVDSRSGRGATGGPSILPATGWCGSPALGRAPCRCWRSAQGCAWPAGTTSAPTGLGRSSSRLRHGRGPCRHGLCLGSGCERLHVIIEH